MGSEVKFNIFVWLLTTENIIFMSKIVRLWLRNCGPIQFLFLRIACGAIFDKVLQNPLLLLTDIFVWTCLKMKVEKYGF